MKNNWYLYIFIFDRLVNLLIMKSLKANEILCFLNYLPVKFFTNYQ